jgi:Zn-dependent alcohol dehydrogenase
MLAMMGLESIFPLIGGHEGAGVVVEVGRGRHQREARRPRVGQLRAQSCGRCRYCSTGRQNLCDNGAGTLGGGMITDGTHRHFVKGDQPVGLLAKLGTFSNHACVSENSVIKVDDDLPLECVALVSCGVATGWGSATNRADVGPGDTVVVVGIGGIGINAVQGAKMAGAKRVIAIDPLEFKREKAMEFGATHTFASMEEADARSPSSPGADGRQGDHDPRRALRRHDGARPRPHRQGRHLRGHRDRADDPDQAAVNLFQLAMWNKEIKGTIFGSLNPRARHPQAARLYREGTLKLDELITKRYSLDEINVGYQAMRDGENIRGVIV